MLYPDRLETHRIVSFAKQGDVLFDHVSRAPMDDLNRPIVFDRFVNLGEAGWHCERLDFTHIEVICKGRKVMVDRFKVSARLGVVR